LERFQFIPSSSLYVSRDKWLAADIALAAVWSLHRERKDHTAPMVYWARMLPDPIARRPPSPARACFAPAVLQKNYEYILVAASWHHNVQNNRSEKSNFVSVVIRVQHWQTRARLCKTTSKQTRTEIIFENDKND
jgi:hypothetical protein